jgi:DNA-binding SARP family transcriptional activator/TolB-like protein
MKLHLFGSPHFEVSGNNIAGIPAKAFVAIALLAIKFGGEARRSVLASHLWENQESKSANANLRQLLAGIRRFESKNNFLILQTGRERVHLNIDISNDLKKFVELKSPKNSAGLTEHTIERQKEFLHGLEYVVGEDVQNWIVAVRQEYAARFLEISLENAVQFGGDAGVKALEFLLSRHPYQGKLLRALILVHSRSQNYAAIYRCFESFKNTLQHDLGVDPSRKTLDLIARVAPELIPDLEREFWFLSKTPTKVHTPIAANKTLSDNNIEDNSSSLPRLIILPPRADVDGIHPTERALINSMVEDLSLCLCRMRSVVVLAPHTARKFVTHDRMQTFIDVDYIVSTRYLSSGPNGKLAVSLTCVSTGELLMAEEIPVDVVNVFEDCRHLFLTAAHRIGLEIDNSVLSSFRHTGQASAYTYYLIGSNRLRSDDLPSVRAARSAFRHAVKLSPDLYVAQQMLAHTFHREWFLLGRRDTERLKEAQMLAEQLIRTDPFAPGGHWELGVALLYLGDLDGALASTTTAALRAPHHADILMHRADILCHNGQHEKALQQIGSALKLNPLPPDIYFWNIAGIRFLLGDYQKSLYAISKVSVLVPSNLRLVAACHAMLGNLEQANHFKQLHLAEYPDFEVGSWSKIYPAKKQNDVEHYVGALRLAGFT